jgi:thioesterase domain-containing protein
LIAIVGGYFGAYATIASGQAEIKRLETRLTALGGTFSLGTFEERLQKIENALQAQQPQAPAGKANP